VPWEGNRSAKYYINKYAASFDSDAKKRSTLVTQANGKVQNTQNYLLFKRYPAVEKGGSIFVDIKDRKKPENKKQRVDRRQINFQQAATAAIPLLSVVILLRDALRPRTP